MKNDIFFDQLDPEKDPSQDGKTGGIYQYVARDEYGLSLHYFQGDCQMRSSFENNEGKPGVIQVNSNIKNGTTKIN
ncbi:MAG: hypothetical protein ACT6QS_08125 [Flavobacteriales bacterium]